MSEDVSRIGLALRAALERLAILEQLLSELYGTYVNLGMGVVGLEALLREQAEPLDPAALHAVVGQLEQIVTQVEGARLSERITGYQQGVAPIAPTPYQQVRAGLGLLEAVHRGMHEQIARRTTDTRAAAVAEAADQIWHEVLAAHDAALEQALVRIPQVVQQINDLEPPTITLSA